MSNGKGSKPRPYSVKYSQYCDNYDNIFRKKKPTEKSVNVNPNWKVVIANPDYKGKVKITPNEK